MSQSQSRQTTNALPETGALYEARLAVEVAKAAIEAGDKEAIADARVGLEGAGLAHLDLYGRLFEAETPLSADEATTLDALWQEALALLTKKRKVKIFVDGEELPALEARPPLALKLDTNTILQGLKRFLQKHEAVGVVELLPQVATRESRDRFFAALAEAWRRHGERAPERWAFQAMGPLGGDLCAKTIAANLEKLTHARAEDGLNMLAHIGTHQALYAAYALGYLPGCYGSRRYKARQVFAQAAERSGVSPRVGALSLAPAAPQEGLERRVDIAVRHSLLLAMREGHRYTQADFDRIVRRHPLVATLSRGLIWGCFADDEPRAALLVAFRVDDELELRDVKDEPVELPKDGVVGVAHPVELEAQKTYSSQAWQGRLNALKLRQPIQQLARPTPRFGDAALEQTAMTDFAQREINFFRLRDTLRGREWFEGEVFHGDDENLHDVESFARELPRSGGAVAANLGGGRVASITCAPGADYYEMQANRPEPLSWLHPVDQVEVLADLEAALGPLHTPSGPPRPNRVRGEGESGTPRKQAAPSSPSARGEDVLPQTGRFPFAELAKSSRSKCVVCGEKIEKGTVRIGIERLIETPNFTGRGAAYLHPGCRDDCPELLAIDDLDAILSAKTPELWPPTE